LEFIIPINVGLQAKQNVFYKLLCFYRHNGRGFKLTFDDFKLVSPKGYYVSANFDSYGHQSMVAPMDLLGDVGSSNDKLELTFDFMVGGKYLNFHLNRDLIVESSSKYSSGHDRQALTPSR
jgi:hypothetical protein